MKTTLNVMLVLTLVFLGGCGRNTALEGRVNGLEKKNGEQDKSILLLAEGLKENTNTLSRVDQNVQQIIQQHARGANQPHIPQYSDPIRFQYDGFDITHVPGYEPAGDGFTDRVRQMLGGQADSTNLMDRFDDMCFARVEKILAKARQVDRNPDKLDELVELLKQGNDLQKQNSQKLDQLLERKPSTTIIQPEVTPVIPPAPALPPGGPLLMEEVPPVSWRVNPPARFMQVLPAARTYSTGPAAYRKFDGGRSHPVIEWHRW